MTVYEEIDPPPFTTGALHDTVTWPAPPTPDTPVGAPGTVAGMTADDTAEC